MSLIQHLFLQSFWKNEACFGGLLSILREIGIPQQHLELEIEPSSTLSSKAVIPEDWVWNHRRITGGFISVTK